MEPGCMVEKFDPTKRVSQEMTLCPMHLGALQSADERAWFENKLIKLQQQLT